MSEDETAHHVDTHLTEDEAEALRAHLATLPDQFLEEWIAGSDREPGRERIAALVTKLFESPLPATDAALARIDRACAAFADTIYRLAVLCAHDVGADKADVVHVYRTLALMGLSANRQLHASPRDA